MKITLHLVALSCLALSALTLAGAQSLPRSFPRIERESSQPRELISEGLGVGQVYVWHSTAEDVEAAYGKDFERIEHGAHTVEMRYATRDLSFFYCQSDSRKRIIDIECRAPFRGFTARGVTLGKSTVRDVFKAYGEAKPSTSSNNTYWTFSYPGVEFSIPYKDKPAASLLGEKITVIDVTTPRSGSDCLATNLK